MMWSSSFPFANATAVRFRSPTDSSEIPWDVYLDGPFTVEQLEQILAEAKRQVVENAAKPQGILGLIDDARKRWPELTATQPVADIPKDNIPF